ncbi:hypothetical protein DL96DRAFT_1505161 [Flagelloscypha sp. PMI_526]|nr:hypothetical protein DL96DRAFT_1505161 [Flagelloscypha sp. PMI_526]
MPVTELATFTLKPSVLPNDPILLNILDSASVQQSKWSGIPLLFFQDGQTRIYLLSGWQSVEAHYEWIATDENKKLMEQLTPLIENVELVHLDIDFEKSFPRDLDKLVIVRNKEATFEGETYASGKDVENSASDVYYHFAKDGEGSSRIVLPSGSPTLLSRSD